MRIIEAGPEHIETVRRLFQAYADSLPFSLDFQDFASELAELPGAYAPPRGCLLLAEQSAHAIGTAALKPLAAGIGEVKRLYLAPQARGLGLGKALLERLVDEARCRGYDRLRLDSHRTSMGAAIALYRRLGFGEIPPYGPNLDRQLAFFELPLR